MSKNTKENKEMLLTALKDSMGNISVACKVVGIARKTFYNWKEEDDEFRKKAEEVILEQKKEMDDYAEGKLFEHIKEGNIASLIFYLKTRHPNYKLKMKIEGKIKSEVSLSKEEKELLMQALKYAYGEPGEDSERNN